MTLRGGLLIVAFSVVAGCSAGSPAPPSSGVTQPTTQGSPVRVLMLTATKGFRHDSISVAREVMGGLAASTGTFTVTTTEDVPSITPATLSTYDVIFFALTTGELEFSPDQKNAIVNFVSQGKGFLGVHSATDTLYEWPDYGRLVGAYLQGAPVDAVCDSGRRRCVESVDIRSGRSILHQRGVLHFSR